MAVPMRSTDFRSIVEPILNETFDGIYNQRADEWKGVFTERTGTPRSYHEEPVLFGFNAAPEMPDGTPVTFDAGGVLFIQRYVYKVFGLAFALTKVLVEDLVDVSLNTASLANAALQLRVVGINPAPDNVVGDAFTIAQVQIAEHAYNAYSVLKS